MNRALVLAAGTAAIVAGTLAGCSSDKSTSEQVSSATDSAKSAASSVSEAVTGDAGDSKVTVDGADQKVEGPVVCTAMGGNVQIAMGGGLGAQLSEGDNPVVHQVGLGNFNGQALARFDVALRQMVFVPDIEVVNGGLDFFFGSIGVPLAARDDEVFGKRGFAGHGSRQSRADASPGGGSSIAAPIGGSHCREQHQGHAGASAWPDALDGETARPVVCAGSGAGPVGSADQREVQAGSAD